MLGALEKKVISEHTTYRKQKGTFSERRKKKVEQNFLLRSNFRFIGLSPEIGSFFFGIQFTPLSHP